jgi:uncharacterized protein
MAYLLLLLSAFAAGVINSIAGGGTLLTFPSLVAFGVPAVAANATSTVALVPGSFGAFIRYRNDLRGAREELWWMAVPSVVGGVLGALLVVRAGDELLGKLVPYLILGAALLFTLQEPIKRVFGGSKKAVDEPEKVQTSRRWVGAAFQFVVAIYGGFFGAGIGILMLAAMSLRGMRDVHRMNGVKNLAAVCINGVAAVSFALLGKVRWPLALAMAAAAMAGGFVGAGVAKRIDQRIVRATISIIGFSIGIWTLVRPLGR